MWRAPLRGSEEAWGSEEARQRGPRSARSFSSESGMSLRPRAPRRAHRACPRGGGARGARAPCEGGVVDFVAESGREALVQPLHQLQVALERVERHALLAVARAPLLRLGRGLLHRLPEPNVPLLHAPHLLLRPPQRPREGDPFSLPLPTGAGAER